MARQKQERHLQAVLDQIEIDVAQAVDHTALDAALSRFTSPASSAVELYRLAGPAKLLLLVLAGFELPDAPARAVSSEHLLALLKTLPTLPEPLREQVLLILEQQQDVLLAMVEQDLEAIHASSERIDLRAQEDVLATLHHELRLATKDVSPAPLAWAVGA